MPSDPIGSTDSTGLRPPFNGIIKKKNDLEGRALSCTTNQIDKEFEF